MKKVIIVLSAIVALISLSASQPRALVRQKDIAGRWVGFEKSFWVFYDLNLEADGTGSLVDLNEDNSPDVYRIHWSITNIPSKQPLGNARSSHDWHEDQLFQAQTLDATLGSGAVTLNSERFDSERIYLKVAGLFVRDGITNRWDREVELIHAQDVLAKIKESIKHEPKLNRK